MLYIGSHVSFDSKEQLVKSVKECISYGANTFMFYAGAPQNTNRCIIDDSLTYKAYELMKENNIFLEKVICHAPYIVNLANDDENKYQFAINFLIDEIKRCESLGIKYLVLHPGSHVGLGIDKGIVNIIFALNQVLKNSKVTILIETMAGKGSEIGSNFEELKQIINGVEEKNNIGVCMDTCHLHDSGYDVSNFDDILDDFDKKIGLQYLKCIHINDSKNVVGAHKDRHENLGYGEIGFDNMIKIIYNERIKDIPKILETPYINGNPPYKEEIAMITNKEFTKLK